jgi:hypothetical protein
MIRYYTFLQRIGRMPMIVLAAAFLHAWWGVLMLLDVNTPGMNAVGYLGLIIGNEAYLAWIMISTSILALIGLLWVDNRIGYATVLCPQQVLMWTVCLLQHWGAWENSHDWHTLIAMPAIDGLAIFHTLYLWTAARA